MGVVLFVFSGVHIGLKLGQSTLPKEQLAFQPEKSMASCPNCRGDIQKPWLDAALSHAVEFILLHQNTDGSFQYGYDWAYKKNYPNEKPEFVAAVLWRLVLLYEETREKRLLESIELGLGFLEKGISAMTQTGRKGEASITAAETNTGFAAFMALLLSDYLRVAESISDQSRMGLSAKLNICIDLMLLAKTDKGRFRKSCAFSKKQCQGEPERILDGQVLLALIKAAKYRPDHDIQNLIRNECLPGYLSNLKKTFMEKSPKNPWREFQPWAALICHELATSGWAETEQSKVLLHESARFLMEQEEIIRPKQPLTNLLPALIIASDSANEASAASSKNHLIQAVNWLLASSAAYQIFPSTAHDRLCRPKSTDKLAVGGVLSDPRFPLLSLEATTRWMHALVLARRHCR